MQLGALLLTGALFSGGLLSPPAFAEEILTPSAVAPVPTRTFSATGVIQSLTADQQTVVIKHSAISNYMGAMTMPFKVRNSHLLAGMQPGDEITFQLNVTADESWVNEFRKIGTAAVDPQPVAVAPPQNPAPSEAFMNYALTNELGERVTLQSFHGQALAITFFYTRCPLPDYCPRLSRNFQAAAEQLRALSGGPTNWHFLSISFDTEFDTPALLRSYGESFSYHPSEWSFLTGAPADIKELARISGVNYTASSGGFQHNFRTLIVDANGHLQMIFPTGGDLSADIAAQMIKAAHPNTNSNLSVRVP